MCNTAMFNPLNYLTPSGWKKMYGMETKPPAAPKIVQSAKLPDDSQATKASDDERRRLAALGQTIKTSGRGLGDTALTSKKVLLGQ